jgi:hypothetical protein
VLEDLRALEARDRLLGAEDGAAERVIGPERGYENLVHEIVRRVLDHPDFLEDHAALHLHVFSGEARRGDDVGQQIERGRHLLVEHVRVERGVLLAGERVDVASEDVDDFGDVGGGAALGAFEDEMLEKVRRAAVLFRLHCRAAAQIEPERGGANVRQRFDDDREAGGKRGFEDRRRRASHARRIVAGKRPTSRRAPCAALRSLS